MQVIRLGFGPDYVDYQRAWDLQRELHAKVVAGEEPDTALLLEHAAVYTAGKRTEAHERPLDGTPVIDVDRGGKITWHGPGQIVGYPIVRLPEPIDVVAHVRRLEDMMIRVCARLRGRRRPGSRDAAGRGCCRRRRPRRPRGAPDRKIGAIGIRVSQSVTMHGFALNCDNDLGWADVIIPCGIVGAGVTSLTKELGRDVTVHEVLPYVEKHLVDVLG